MYANSLIYETRKLPAVE